MGCAGVGVGVWGGGRGSERPAWRCRYSHGLQTRSPGLQRLLEGEASPGSGGEGHCETSELRRDPGEPAELGGRFLGPSVPRARAGAGGRRGRPAAALAGRAATVSASGGGGGPSREATRAEHRPGTARPWPRRGRV